MSVAAAVSSCGGLLGRPAPGQAVHFRESVKTCRWPYASLYVPWGPPKGACCQLSGVVCTQVRRLGLRKETEAEARAAHHGSDSEGEPREASHLRRLIACLQRVACPGQHWAGAPSPAAPEFFAGGQQGLSGQHWAGSASAHVPPGTGWGHCAMINAAHAISFPMHVARMQQRRPRVR